jgi:uncharacterized damage-inducible protein DinB
VHGLPVEKIAFIVHHRRQSVKENFADAEKVDLGFSFGFCIFEVNASALKLSSTIFMGNVTNSPELLVAEARRHLMQEYLPWLRGCLVKLSEQDIWWRPNEKSNSIGNLVLHLCGNIRQWVIHGVGGAADLRNRPAEFATRESCPKAELLEKLESTLVEVDAVLARLPVEKLTEPRVIQGFDVTVLGAIFHVVEHFSYHTGQIIYITKMRTGEDLKFWNV